MNLNVFAIAAPKARLLTKVLLIMRLTTILLIIAIIQVSAKGYGQKINLNESGKSLKQVFKAIEKQTPYVFFYDNNDVKTAKVKIILKDGSIDEALSECFKNLPLTYKIIEKNIIVSKKEEHSSIVSTPIAVQKIQGRVVDTTGRPLPGVSIRIKQSSVGTTSNVEGYYTINVPDDKAVLVFSFIGFLPQEVKVGDNTTLNVTLHEDKKTLNEVVVVGYGTQNRTKVTGAITTVKMDDVLGDRPVSTMSTLMQGVVPGLQVSAGSGQPGSSATFNVRGATDLNTNPVNKPINTGGPLILVDNVPFNGSLNLLDPNDIETISTLKDAGSAAIYGGRSAFGVILVTTKKGKKNQKTQFNYSNNISFASAVNLPEKAAPLQFLQTLKDMGTTGYWSGQNVDTWLQLENDYIANPGKYPNGITTVAGMQYQLAATDVLKDLLGSSVPQIENNFSISGGSDKTTYRLSLGTVNDKGIMAPNAKQDKFNRYNVKSVVSSDVTNWLTTQLDMGYYNSLNSTPFNNQFYNAVNFPTLTPNSYYLTSSGGVTGINGTPVNIVSNSAPSTAQNSDIRITGRSILKPAKGLTVTGEYTYDNLSTDRTAYDKMANFVNSSNFSYGPNGSGTYKLANVSAVYKALNIYANYEKSVGNHNFSVLAGYNQEDNVAKLDSISRNGMIAANLPSISQATGPITAGDSYASYSLQGYFGRLNYDYKNKYLVQLNGRYDGSSNFPPNHRFGFFPSGSLGWRVTEEDFMEHIKPVLSEFKLRASLGNVGNQNISPYSFIPVLNSIQPYWLNGTGSYLTSLTSPPIISSTFTWETVQTLDFGVDYALFGNRLNGSFDWFQRDTKNILAAGAVPLPAVLGTPAPLQNTASLSSKGYEIQINWRDKIGNVKYRLGVNLYDFKAKITKFDGNPSNLLNTYYTGQQLGEMYGYVTDRLYTTNDFVPGSLNSNLTGGTLKPGIPKLQGENPNPGDVLFKDLNGDGVITPGNGTKSNSGDQKVIGNNSLRYQYGINGGVTYKNFDFSFVINGVGKQDIFPVSPLTFPNQYAFGTTYAHELNYWTPTNTDAHFGRIYDQANGNQGFNQTTQTKFLLSGAYLKIRNLTLAYTVPPEMIKKIHMYSLRVFYSIENPFTFDHLAKGLDPSSTDQGAGLGYPFLRVSSFGVNLSF